MAPETKELVVPAGQVNELLGVKSPKLVGPTPDVSVHLRQLTVTHPANPAFGEWVDRKAVLRWMEAHNRKAGGSQLLEGMIRQYRAVLEV